MNKIMYDVQRPRDVALAATSACRILIEFLVKAGIERSEIEKAFSAKAAELIGEQYEDNAGNLLRMMGGVAKSVKRGG